MKKKLIVANWKMNPETSSEAVALFDDIKTVAAKLRNVDTVLVPPLVFLPILKGNYRGTKIFFGVQNVHHEMRGSYTGEISVPMLKDMKANYVIIGHSERRAMGERNELLNKKMKTVLSNGLTAILCIGEKERDSAAEYLSFLKEELIVALSAITKPQLKNVVIAYEPLWAIGKTKDDAMRPEQVHEMVIFIRKILVERFSKSVAMNVPVLYGGSVEPENAASLLERGEISGFLVGHASLHAESFTKILKIANI